MCVCVYVQFTVRCSFRISSSRPTSVHSYRQGRRVGEGVAWKEGELAEPAGSYVRGGGKSKSYLQYFAAAGEIET